MRRGGSLVAGRGIGAEGCQAEPSQDAVTVLPRSSGVLLHPTSLPSGRLDDDAYRFVDWLAAAGQTWWQVLPVAPPDETGSPYASPSAFAGWVGLLADPDAPVSADDVDEFVARNPYWIGGWAAHHGPGAVAGQVRFEREWTALRAYAAERGVRDPRRRAHLRRAGRSPPPRQPRPLPARRRGRRAADLFSSDGQLWGNPLDWDALRATEFRWWVERFYGARSRSSTSRASTTPGASWPTGPSPRGPCDRQARTLAARARA